MYSSESVSASRPDSDFDAENNFNSEDELDSILDKQFSVRIAGQRDISNVLHEYLQPVFSQFSSFTLAAPGVLDVLMTSLDFDVALLWQPSADGVELICTYQRSRSGQAFSDFCAQASRLSLWPAEGLAGRVWASGTGAFIEEMAEDGHSERAALAAKHGFRCVVGFPILNGNKMQYVVELFSRQSHKQDHHIVGSLSRLGAEIQYLLGCSQSQGSDRLPESSLAGTSLNERPF